MKAVGFRQSLPLDHPEALLDLEMPRPEPRERDLIVEVRAVSVNPVDHWIRVSSSPEPGEPVVLGMDAAGIVREVGSGVCLFKPGDKVWYSGSFQRQGSASELHAVDERLVAKMPESLGFAEAAALPLTAITAWELLFERMDVPRHTLGGEEALLIAGAAGGVGSILTQIARALTNLRVIGTASRPETRDWVRAMGAHAVVDYREPLAPQLAALGMGEVDYVASLTQTHRNLEALIGAIKPRGHFGLIDASGPMDLRAFMSRNLSIHYQDMGMLTKMAMEDEYLRHHRILSRVARLVDEGVLRTTMNAKLGKINAENMRRAHGLVESGHVCGKIVLEGF